MSELQQDDDASSEQSTITSQYIAPPAAATAGGQSRTSIRVAKLALVVSLISVALGAYTIARSAIDNNRNVYYSQPHDLAGFIARAEESIVEILCNGTGTGFAFDIEPEEPGFSTVIVTNFHVVEDCIDNPDMIRVYTLSQEDYEAKVKVHLRKFNKDADLALLEIAEQLPRLFASEYFADRGWWTMAIGNPVDADFEDEAETLYNATTFGHISYVLDETWNYTSATINGGNSGGPLLDSRGNVIGINTLAAASTEDGVWNIAIDTDVLCETLIECE